MLSPSIGGSRIYHGGICWREHRLDLRGTPSGSKGRHLGVKTTILGETYPGNTKNFQMCVKSCRGARILASWGEGGKRHIRGAIDYSEGAMMVNGGQPPFAPLDRPATY